MAQFQLSEEQNGAFELLQSGENVFLTGGAGSGKSYVIRAYRQFVDPKQTPILASTGAAAVLVGGRTFHSFFGLGIMEGGPELTLQRALKDGRVLRRISQVEGVIIDEISMIPASALQVAEEIARKARKSELPWGGMRIIAVGDFAQLPPVTRGVSREWCFQSPIWQKTGFQSVVLTHNQRVEDKDFLNVLSEVRNGRVTKTVEDFLNSRLRTNDQNDKSMRLFPRRDQSELFNQTELAMLPFKEHHIDSIYIGESKHVELIKKVSPIPERLTLKEGCRVMFVQNDPQKRWVNGTRGKIIEISADKIRIEKDTGREVTCEKGMFSMQNAEGEVIASLINFPLVLAYATTIHKSQGATLDELWVDLSHLWEPGHAYVALSRLKKAEGLKLLRWSKNSFKIDPEVYRFYQNIM